MSGLKFLVVVLLVETVRSHPHQQRDVRQAYGYPYPYQPSTSYGSSLPYQPGYGSSNLPLGSSQIYPSYQQNYPFYTNPSYPSYGSMYPSYGSAYPAYPSYPTYPSYASNPYQQNFQNYPDPFAHIPTEIVDVDMNGNIDPAFSWDTSKVAVTSAHHSTASGEPLRPVHSDIVEGKPSQTTVTRTFDSESSDPTVNVNYSDSNTQLGSGILIDARANGGENSPDGEEEAAKDNQVQNVEEEETTEEEEEGEKKQEEEEEENKEEKGGKSDFLWG